MSKRVAARASQQQLARELLERPGTRRAYDRRGVLALEPQAFGFFFFGPQVQENTEIGDVTVIHIDGPLDNKDEGWFDSYEAVSRRMQQACESGCKKIVLAINSPGGEAAGCFECSRQLRSMAQAAGKQLFAHVEGRACSGGYALATAANYVCAEESSVVGSIGVISTRADYSAQDEMQGVRFAIVTSGARKADGHPDNPITAGELKATQEIVDTLAGKFFDLVSAHRGLGIDVIKALEANVFVAGTAVSVGLVDEVQSYNALLTELVENQMVKKLRADSSDGDEKSPYEKARAALEDLAKGEGPEAEKAKKALAAMDDDGDGDGDEHKEPDGDEASAEDDGDDAEAAADDEECDTAASSNAGGTAAGLANIVQKLETRLTKVEQQNRTITVKALLDKRPDITKELRAFLMTQPIEAVKTVLAGIKAPTMRQPITTVPATRGASQGTGQEARLPQAEKSALDIAMGLTELKPGVESTEFKLRLGVPQVAPTE